MDDRNAGDTPSISQADQSDFQCQMDGVLPLEVSRDRYEHASLPELVGTKDQQCQAHAVTSNVECQARSSTTDAVCQGDVDGSDTSRRLDNKKPSSDPSKHHHRRRKNTVSSASQCNILGPAPGIDAHSQTDVTDKVKVTLRLEVSENPSQLEGDPDTYDISEEDSDSAPTSALSGQDDGRSSKKSKTSGVSEEESLVNMHSQTDVSGDPKTTSQASGKNYVTSAESQSQTEAGKTIKESESVESSSIDVHSQTELSGQVKSSVSYNTISVAVHSQTDISGPVKNSRAHDSLDTHSQTELSGKVKTSENSSLDAQSQTDVSGKLLTSKSSKEYSELAPETQSHTDVSLKLKGSGTSEMVSVESQSESNASKKPHRSWTHDQYSALSTEAQSRREVSWNPRTSGTFDADSGLSTDAQSRADASERGRASDTYNDDSAIDVQSQSEDRERLKDSRTSEEDSAVSRVDRSRNLENDGVSEEYSALTTDGSQSHKDASGKTKHSGMSENSSLTAHADSKVTDKSKSGLSKEEASRWSVGADSETEASNLSDRKTKTVSYADDSAVLSVNDKVLTNKGAVPRQRVNALTNGESSFKSIRDEYRKAHSSVTESQLESDRNSDGGNWDKSGGGESETGDARNDGTASASVAYTSNAISTADEKSRWVPADSEKIESSAHSQSEFVTTLSEGKTDGGGTSAEQSAATSSVVHNEATGHENSERDAPIPQRHDSIMVAGTSVSSSEAKQERKNGESKFGDLVGRNWSKVAGSKDFECQTGPESRDVGCQFGLAESQ